MDVGKIPVHEATSRNRGLRHTVGSVRSEAGWINFNSQHLGRRKLYYPPISIQKGRCFQERVCRIGLEDIAGDPEVVRVYLVFVGARSRHDEDNAFLEVLVTLGAQAVVGNAQKATRIGRQIDPDDVRALVGHHIEEGVA